MAKLEDSGERKAFESGATRDIQSGKGRCDLLPLDVCSSLLTGKPDIREIMKRIDRFVYFGRYNELYSAIHLFMDLVGWDAETTLLELAKHYEDGAVKYGERNWERGIPLHSYIDSGVRHLLKWSRGDNEERHDRAFIWNMIGAIWTNEAFPKLRDLPFAKCKAEYHEPHPEEVDCRCAPVDPPLGELDCTEKTFASAKNQTYLEKCLENWPNKTESELLGGECPVFYFPKASIPCEKEDGTPLEANCVECWNREYKGEEMKTS